jgi:hypothetical protein
VLSERMGVSLWVVLVSLRQELLAKACDKITCTPDHQDEVTAHTPPKRDPDEKPY